MADLKTNYMGFELKNPIIAGASKLTSNIDKIKSIEEAGAAAIVCGSLFEEQIQLESLKIGNQLSDFSEVDSEISNLFPNHIDHSGPKEHLFWLEKTKKESSVPVIGSLNCVNRDTWLDYAKQVESTGVDGIELNFFHVPTSFDLSAEEVENEQLEIIKELKSEIKIPIAAKLSYFYSNPLNFIKKIDNLRVDGLVLFNRLFQPDINVLDKSHQAPFNLSNHGDLGISLRFAGLLFNNVKTSVCSNTGFFTGFDIIKAILAGSNAVQVVSTLYKNDISVIKTMINEINKWMTENEFNTIEEFRGLLSRENTEDPFVYQRAQYVSLLLKSEELLKKYDR